MKTFTFLFLVPALGAVLSTSALAQASARPSGNTGSTAGIPGKPGLGDTPGDSPTNTSTGNVTKVNPGSPAPPVVNGTGGAGTGPTDASHGVTRSSGAGIIDGSTRQQTGTPSFGAGTGTGTSSGTAPSVPVPVVPSGTGTGSGNSLNK